MLLVDICFLACNVTKVKGFDEGRAKEESREDRRVLVPQQSEVSGTR